MLYADIVIDISAEDLDRSFSYRVPEELEKDIRLGMVVCVPFGKGGRLRKGYVTGLSNSAGYDEDKIKDIIRVCSDARTTESDLVELAVWMKETYGSTMIQALRTVFPIREKVKTRIRKEAVLQLPAEEAAELLGRMKKTRFRARTRFLEALLLSGGRMELGSPASTGLTKDAAGYFEKEGIIRIESDEILRDVVKRNSGDNSLPAPALMPAQQEAVRQIREEWQNKEPRPVLLHGVTGSGKTEVYMELIEETIESGKQVIVLIPEIALTFQTVRRFSARFGNLVSVMNSRLSRGERYEQFVRAEKGEIRIMVGPRSALFSPFDNLGLIIIDEEHEPTYQSENSPRYHARETAIQRAAMQNARVLLGSATPSLEAYSRCRSGEFRLVKLEGRYRQRPLPEVSIVDMRPEIRAGNRSILSRELQQGIRECLDGGNQAMLFLNRRGLSGFVSCRSCGHVIKCPHCDVSLSEHENGRLVCHYCGYETSKPGKCPECASPYIGGFKAGTQAAERTVRTLYPDARVLRMDFDTTRKKGGYEEILAAFSNHEADILIGTQMIVKGHDFPDVTLVGSLCADLSLNAADFRCAERTYQLLVQACGRAGRGEKPGKAVLQTYHPDHYSIRAAACQDYDSFYEQEIRFRDLMEYPPGGYMTGIFGQAENEELLTKGMFFIRQYIERICGEHVPNLTGPAPASVGKVRDVYRQVLYMRHENRDYLIRIRERLERYIEINPGFREIRVQYGLL